VSRGKYSARSIVTAHKTERLGEEGGEGERTVDVIDLLAQPIRQSDDIL
jgi:hypothetical protein